MNILTAARDRQRRAELLAWYTAQAEDSTKYVLAEMDAFQRTLLEIRGLPEATR